MRHCVDLDALLCLPPLREKTAVDDIRWITPPQERLSKLEFSAVGPPKTGLLERSRRKLSENVPFGVGNHARCGGTDGWKTVRGGVAYFVSYGTWAMLHRELLLLVSRVCREEVLLLVSLPQPA